MVPTMIDVESAIKARFELLAPLLNERTRRLISAAEAGVLGRGGITIVSRITGVSRRAIAAGLAELRSPDGSSPERIRRPGGGRRRRVLDDTTLQDDLEHLINPISRGDLNSPLRWTCTSVRKLAEQLIRMGHATSHRMVADMLHELGYRLQSKRKRVEGQGPKSRDVQFDFINREVEEAFRLGHPVIVIDAGQKELEGRDEPEFKDAGPYEAPGPPLLAEPVDHGPGSQKPPRPRNLPRLKGRGRTGVVADRESATLTVEVIRRWWETMGHPYFPRAPRILVVADISGGEELAARVWQSRLQKLADETRLMISVYHFPQATTRWCHIEHRLVATTSLQWRNRPELTREIAVSLVARGPLELRSELSQGATDAGPPRSIELSYEEIENLLLQSGRFFSDWNYSIEPASSTP